MTPQQYQKLQRENPLLYLDQYRKIGGVYWEPFNQNNRGIIRKMSAKQLIAEAFEGIMTGDYKWFQYDPDVPF